VRQPGRNLRAGFFAGCAGAIELRIAEIRRMSEMIKKSFAVASWLWAFSSTRKRRAIVLYCYLQWRLWIFGAQGPDIARANPGS
jgi:hypothetical protein